ncbi:MAG: ABC transporter permease [Vicinamibacterales bacterium]
MLANLAAVWRYRDLVRSLVGRDLRVKYKGSTLGFGWSLLHPLVMAAVYTVAFRYVLQVRIERFPVFLLSGLLPWMFMAGALAQATGSVADNGVLVRKVAFPRLVLPLGAVFSQFVQFALMYLVIVPGALLLGSAWTFAIVGVIPVMLLQLLFTVGLGLLTSTAYVYFRDTRHLLDVGLQIWFWGTPVVYSLSLVPEPLARLLLINPMTLFVTSYQQLVMEARMPSAATTLGMLASSVGAAIIGWSVFSRHQRRFAELV